jgi:hypothetical protein
MFAPKTSRSFMSGKTPMTSSDFQKNDRFESISVACDNFLSVRCVPKAEAHVAFFSVSFGENRRQKKIYLRAAG